jgi:exodeoxyribonuclease VII large subunit
MNQAMSVSSLNIKIKALLETTFMHILVEGEVSSVTYHNSGHVYFSIKDSKSSLKCVMFRSNANRMKFRLERGQKVVVNGSISVYAPRGEYQLMTFSVEPFGRGALELAYEQLKKKLQNKGYFDSERKKEQPKYIKKLALVTASKSAALHDMLKIIDKRWRLVEVTVVDTLVQGEKSATQIAKALAYADTLGVDAIVVGRGGGSREDLWAFNEEVVADAIFGLNTFVVSAVGHEVDVLISDFVADLRAPTPSAAIEMILPDQNEMLYMLLEIQDRYDRAIKQTILAKERGVKSLSEELQRYSVSKRLSLVEKEFKTLQEEFGRVVDYKISLYESKLSSLPKQFSQSMNYSLEVKMGKISALEQQLKLNNPKKRQRDGYAEIIMDGKKVKLSTINSGDRFTLVDVESKVKVEAI